MGQDIAGRFEGVVVPDPEFAGDDGTIDPRLAAVLTDHDEGRATVRDVVTVLAAARLMTPLLAVLDEVEESPDGLAQDKSSHLASVSLVAADGRRGLLAFSSVESMAAWDPAARGIPAPARRVAAAALEEGADAVLLDLGGPVRVAIAGTALRCLATGEPVPPAYADPEVGTAVLAALEGLAGLAGVLLEPPVAGEELAPDLVVIVAPAAGVDVGPLAAAVAQRLVGHPLVRAACPRGIAVGVGATDS